MIIGGLLRVLLFQGWWERGQSREIEIPKEHYHMLYAVANIGGMQLKSLFGFYNKKKIKSLSQLQFADVS
ncbi:hypothetical protein J2S00_004002 [Caldalkalibacillus uzonensis]|uniref:Uncharacterized protein n=1 Tax=Caldalkalibacillus uzonensis TaxID=353224 RepID=A0ABU0CYD6_9BACI|nr:hypothetical protein [Caldalkalibacillus uzonensis]MDQ0341158.1 hypothetical protein [Caldalkalibacillus uzonensis]